MIQLSQRLNPAVECISILARRFSQHPGAPRSLREEILYICQKYKLPTESLLPLLDPLIQIETHVLEGLLPIEENVQLLFAYHNNPDIANLAWGMYFLDQMNITLADLSPQERLPYLHVLLCFCLGGTNGDLDGVADLASLSLYLEDLSCPPCVKWICQLFWCQPEKYQSRYRQIMARGIELFRQVEHLADPLLEQMLPGIQEALKDETHNSHLPLHFQPDESMPSYPMAMNFHCSSVIYCYNLPETHEHPSFTKLHLVGMLRQHLTELLAQYNNACASIAGSARAISDVHRVEILQALQDGPLCNLELAQKLDFSAATVSHHMSYLISELFVTAVKRGNRVEYTLNKDKLRQFLRLFRISILQDDGE